MTQTNAQKVGLFPDPYCALTALFESRDYIWTPWDTDPIDRDESPPVLEQDASPAPAPAAASTEDEHTAPDELHWGVWSSDPFTLIQVLFGALLEPDGYAAMRALRQRKTMSYAARMPHTYAVAEAIYDTVVVREAWGQHMRPKKDFSKEGEHGRSFLDVIWLTHTAGRWMRKKGHKNGDGKTEGEQKDDETSTKGEVKGKKPSNGFPEARLRH